jgi:hypothetical protein
MTTQKTFKHRVRTRMTKTGESYAAARAQLLAKTDAPAAAVERVETARPPAAPPPVDASLLSTTPEAVLRATGRSHADWFGALDAWGGTEHTHTEIAAWLQAQHAVQGWWAQSITVDYERARGLRAIHQNSGGFSVSVTRTVVGTPDEVLAAFTDARRRPAWLPDVELRRRPTRAAGTARFDWPDPPSRVVVLVSAKGDGRTTLNVTHEQLPDAAATDRLKAMWRERLDALKEVLARR